jgi:hypothetical protein
VFSLPAVRQIMTQMQCAASAVDLALRHSARKPQALESLLALALRTSNRCTGQWHATGKLCLIQTRSQHVSDSESERAITSPVTCTASGNR